MLWDGRWLAEVVLGDELVEVLVVLGLFSGVMLHSCRHLRTEVDVEIVELGEFRRLDLEREVSTVRGKPRHEALVEWFRLDLAEPFVAVVGFFLLSAISFLEHLRHLHLFDALRLHRRQVELHLIELQRSRWCLPTLLLRLVRLVDHV